MHGVMLFVFNRIHCIPIPSYVHFCSLQRNDVRAIHIAGTNGKGTVANKIAMLLEAAGLRGNQYSQVSARTAAATGHVAPMSDM